MNKRLEQFLNAENISQSQFADSIGVARASVSHIIAGRNKPGFDFLERTVKNFPALNIDWLITGNGKMYRSASEYSGQDRLFPYTEESADITEDLSETRSGQGEMAESPKTISKIIVCYTDNTFKEIF